MTEVEMVVTADHVRELLRDQHPDLAGLPLREVEGGWGNQTWRLGDALAVRIQRMGTDPEPQLEKRRWLPLLAPRLPLPVPVPEPDGAPTARCPALWTVVTWVVVADGTLAGVVDLGDLFAGDPVADLAAAWVLLGQNGDRGRPVVQPGRGPAGRAALDRVLRA